MKQCTRCGSYAINESMHGRVVGQKSWLCDVCYWRDKAAGLGSALWGAEGQWGDDYIWKKYGFSDELTDQVKDEIKAWTEGQS